MKKQKDFILVISVRIGLEVNWYKTKYYNLYKYIRKRPRKNLMLFYGFDGFKS